MFIPRTTIKSRESGEPYYTYRLVESVRVAAGVRQHTLLNLGRNFEVPRAQWAPLAQRVEALLGGQLEGKVSTAELNDVRAKIVALVGPEPHQ